MLRVLIIAPDAGLDVQTEVFQASSGYAPKILAGTVSRARALEQIASGCFDIVHFATHGREHVLMLSDGVVEEEMLEHAVRRAGSLKVLFLNACRSAHTAVEVYNHSDVAYSIGWPRDVEDGIALNWARLFYEALAIEPEDVGRAAEVANDSVVRSYHVDPDRLPLVLNGRALALKREYQRLRAELERADMMRFPLWAVVVNAALVFLLVVNLIILALLH